MVEKKMENAILAAQQSEITEHFVYEKLSQSALDPHNKAVLKQISDDELKHYNFWKKYTRQDAKPNKLSLWKYYLISRIFGITFGIKLMEKVEGKAQAIYEEISKYVPAANLRQALCGNSRLKHRQPRRPRLSKQHQNRFMVSCPTQVFCWG